MNNIILTQIIGTDSSYSFREIIPFSNENKYPQTLIKCDNENILWSPIDLSLNLVVNDKVKDTNIYYNEERIGVGRFPLHNYKVDIAIPKNTLMTAFHVGDGSFGFSMGNGTTKGFIPEIIGVGSEKDDAGLYFVGIAGNDEPSDIPLIVMDGRNTFSTQLNNRPIFGVTSGNYNDYAMLIDCSNNVAVKGNIKVSDVLIRNISLLKIIADLQQQLNELKTNITKK